MHQDDVMSTLKDKLPILQSRFRVKSLSVFGSVARGEDKPGSDVDVLVEFAQAPNFDLFMDLKFYLEELLKTKVDLVTNHALKPRLRPSIEKEALRVA